MKQALPIIDVQNDYFEGGRSQLWRASEALANIEKVLAVFRQKGLPVIHIQHINGPGSSFFLPDTYGVQIHQNLAPLDGEYHLVKHMPSGFLGTNLSALLKDNGITDVVICGMMSHMCIDTTVRACQDFGLNVTLLDDACATKDLKYGGETIPAQTVHKTFMASLNGVFADVMMADELKI
ncbi:MAG: cysteine hydrolase [Synergistaceae bacterium]|nr:cysteine hydrolase [Synergistaceae bacterium]